MSQSRRTYARISTAAALAALSIAAVAGCAPADACAEMCTAALSRFETCIAADGQTWGDEVGYADAADYENGCATFVWELRELGQADTCATRLAIFEGGAESDDAEAAEADGDAACAEYYDAWGVE